MYLFCTFKEKRQGGPGGGMSHELILKLEFYQIIIKSNSFLKCAIMYKCTYITKSNVTLTS